MCEVINRNVLDWCKEYSGEKFHALLCDPPYALNFMGKYWDNDIAFKPETWLALKEHLFDGAFLIAFASARGWHRMACAMEDAGLIMHPSIFGWCYGSGFPKATRIKNNEVFVGHRYGLQALKPALEPILVFQKPYSGKPVECITKTGAGALNIDGTRIGHNEPIKETILKQRSAGWNPDNCGFDSTQNITASANPQGRWASNFVLSHTPECLQVGVKKVKANNSPRDNQNTETLLKKGFEGKAKLIECNFGDEDGNETVADRVCPKYCPVRRLGEQSPNVQPCGTTNVGSEGKEIQNKIYGKGYVRTSNADYVGDSGSVSRFFFNSDFVLEKLENADAVIYQAKASKVERNMGCESLPMQKAGGMQGRNDGSFDGKITYNNNNHPTVKPLKLCEHLATLLLPPKEYAPRRILVPFAGSGSEMIGAHLAGWEEIIGIELEKEYCEIAKARLKYWGSQTKITQIATEVIQ